MATTRILQESIRTAFAPDCEPAVPVTFAGSSSSDDYLHLDLPQRVGAIRNIVRGRVVFTTSFGIEDQAIAHAIFTQALLVDVVTLDTGRLFPETYELWARTERRYRRRIRALCPDRAGKPFWPMVPVRRDRDASWSRHRSVGTASAIDV